MAKHNLPPKPHQPSPQEPQSDEQPKEEINYVEVVGSPRVNLRKGPSKESEVVEVLSEHMILIRKMPITSDWVYVRVPDTTISGYVMAIFLKEV